MFICDTPVTAGGRTYLKTLTLAKLKKYVNVYNIKIDRAVEKDDLIDGILSIRVRWMGATIGSFPLTVSTAKRLPATRERGLTQRLAPLLNPN